MSVPVISQLQKQAWGKTMVKEVVSGTLWSTLSNRVDVTSQVANGGVGKIPDSVIHWVSDKFTKGIQKTTIPFMTKLNEMGKGGWEKLEGTEETPKMRYKQLHYNIQRKAIDAQGESVEDDLAEAYNVISHHVNLLTDYFKDLTDYNFQRAFMRGADEYLTLAKYWTGETLTTPPVTESYHPNFLVNGASAPVTYSATDATYGGNIQTALNALGATNTFDLAALESMIKQADASNGVKLQKLGWKTEGNQSVNYIAKISENQAQQLTTATGSGTWRELMTNAGARGVKNRAISGIIGTYRRALVIVDERAPIWDTDSATALADRIQYYKIEDGRTPVAKTAADSGTAELALMLGKSAVGAATIKELKFIDKTFDYEFSKGLAAQRAEGCERMDLINTALSTKPLNQSSFVYATATPGLTL